MKLTRRVAAVAVEDRAWRNPRSRFIDLTDRTPAHVAATNRNRRSNSDRERIGFKISKMSNIRFKRDDRDSLTSAIRRIVPHGELSAFDVLTSRFTAVSRYKLDDALDRRSRRLFTKQGCLVMLLLTPYEYLVRSIFWPIFHRYNM